MFWAGVGLGLVLGAAAASIGVALWWVMLVTKLDCIHLALSVGVLRDELERAKGRDRA